jgi:hypothetical protein
MKEPCIPAKAEMGSEMAKFVGFCRWYSKVQLNQQMYKELPIYLFM